VTAPLPLPSDDVRTLAAGRTGRINGSASRNRTARYRLGALLCWRVLAPIAA